MPTTSNYLEVGVESVLVHRVDGGHLCEDEEKYRSPLGDRPIDVAIFLHLVRRLGRELQLFGHLAGLGLGLVEGVDKFDVVEHVSRGLGQLAKQGVFQVLQPIEILI